MLPSQAKQDSISNESFPHLLRLPPELRDQILAPLLDTARETWVSPTAVPIWGFPLQPNNSMKEDKPIVPTRVHQYAPISSLLSSCQQLRLDTFSLLASHPSPFLVRISVRDDAPTGANHFSQIDQLAPAFRHSIRKLALHVSFMQLTGGCFSCYWKSYWASPWAFEKTIENINELLHLLPGVEELFLVWDMYFGNGGMAARQRRATGQVWRRVRKEWPGRRMRLNARDCMGRVFEEEVEGIQGEGKGVGEYRPLEL